MAEMRVLSKWERAWSGSAQAAAAAARRSRLVMRAIVARVRRKEADLFTVGAQRKTAVRRMWLY
jgi:hypothetical protein